MEKKHTNAGTRALTALAAIAFASSANAAITHLTNSFEAAPVLSSPGFLYGNHDGWTTNGYFYTTNYNSAIRPDPQGTVDPQDPPVALHANNGYSTRILADTYVAGRTYTMTVQLSGDANSTTDNDRTWLYFFDDVNQSDPASFGSGDGLVRARYLRDGTNDSFISVNGTGATSGTNAGWSIGNNIADWTAGGGTWGTATLSYTATAADAGRRIGVSLWAPNDASWDDITVTSVSVVPEPGSTALLGLGGLALILRRRR